MGWPLRCDHKRRDLCGLAFCRDVLDMERDIGMLATIAAEGKCGLGRGQIFTDQDSELG